jgi:hypothetical protein
MEIDMFERLERWIVAALAPTFELLRHVPPRALMRLMTPF